MIRALIFDFDGVVLDTEATLFQAWQEIFHEYGLEIALQEWAGMLGHSADPLEPYLALEEHLKRPIDRDALHSRRVKRETQMLSTEKALPGIESLLLQAKANGIKLAIASSSDRGWVVNHLSRLELIDFFDVIKCAEDVQFTKPHPDLYIAALKELHLDANDAIALEDSLNGVRSAKAAGLFCVAIPNPITRHIPITQADVVLETLEGISLHQLENMVR